MKEGMRRAGWDDLSRELDAWMVEGRVATLWWRDDDAIKVTGALETMLEICKNTRTPLAVAVIPAHAENELRQRIVRCEGVCVLQHGFAHANHEPEGSKKSEFGVLRETGSVESELRQGHERFADWETFVPVFVPPWNRIDDRFLDLLPRLGVIGISTFKARKARYSVPGLQAANCHVDIIESKNGARCFIGVGAALRALIDHLSSRRLGRVDRGEPSGILTHHLDHDEESWTFMEQLLNLIANHPAGRWLGAKEVFINPSQHETV